MKPLHAHAGTFNLLPVMMSSSALPHGKVETDDWCLFPGIFRAICISDHGTLWVQIKLCQD
jgi:hypothetical protein